METQYLGPPKVKGIDDSSSEQKNEKWSQDYARKELILVAQKAAQFHEKYVKRYEYVATQMCSLANDQLCFLVDLLPLPPLTPKATQIQ